MVMAREPEQKAFIPAPAGMQRGVLVDVVDLGLKKNNFTDKEQQKIRLVFQSEKLHPETEKPLLVAGMYTLSLHDKAVLRKVLESWLSRKLTEAERKGFELDDLIGKSALLNIKQSTGSDGNTYANIDTILPLMEGMAKVTPSADYVRVKDRPAKDGKQQSSNTRAADPVDQAEAEEGDANEDYVPSDAEFAGQRVVLSGNAASDIVTVAKTLAFATGHDLEDLIFNASKFKSDEGKEIGFRLPKEKHSSKWLNSTLSKLKRQLEDLGFIAELNSEEVPF